jgi:hypothetical protein
MRITVELGEAWQSEIARLGLNDHEDFLTGPLGAWAALDRLGGAMRRA